MRNFDLIIIRSLALVVITVMNFQTLEAQYSKQDIEYVINHPEKGGFYFGDLANGIKEGFGIYMYNDGTKYIGSWKNNLQQGFGKMIDTKNSSQIGRWEYGFLIEKKELEGCILGDCQNGYSIFWSKNNNVIIGHFENGKTNQGTIIYEDGSRYVGAIANNQPNGNGDLYTINQKVIGGLWSNGRYLGDTKKGKGCVEGDCQNGNGIYIYSDNTYYKGNFRNGLAHGKGLCHYSNGDFYKGNFNEHNFHGFGKLYLNSGELFNGFWEDGEFVGKDEEKFKAGAPNPTEIKFEAPKVWAIVIGVGRYTHMKSLKYTDDDAYRVYAFLKSPQGGALKDEQISLLIDENASKANIMEEMDETFAKVNANDVVFFYFSGHGLRGSFLPSDYDGADNKILHEDLVAKLNGCKAKTKILIADACHSGSLGQYAMKGGDAQSITDAYYKAFQNTKGGTAFLVSSKSDETSIENNGLRQGIFSYFLVRGLNGLADEDKNDVITIHELSTYIQMNVRHYTQGYQHPIIFGDYDENTPLSVTK